MLEEASARMMIKASSTRCFEVVVDFERYPEWAGEVKDVEILERDEQGRALRVGYRAAAMGRTTHYVLRYDYSQAPRRLSWVLTEGDIMRKLDGTFDFDPIDDQTDVTYDLIVDLQVPVPSFLKRRAEDRIIRTLKELKVRAET